MLSLSALLADHFDLPPLRLSGSRPCTAKIALEKCIKVLISMTKSSTECVKGNSDYGVGFGRVSVHL